MTLLKQGIVRRSSLLRPILRNSLLRTAGGCGVPIWADNGDGTVTITSGAPCPPPIWTDNGDGTVTITSAKDA